MTYPCSKEAEIATLKENAKWQNEKLSKIEANTDALIVRMNENDIKWAKVSILAVAAGAIGSAALQIGMALAN